MAKRVVGVFCVIGAFAAGITQIFKAKTPQEVIGFIIVTLIFAVPAFFLLKPTKNITYFTNFNLPPNGQSNKTGKRAGSVAKKVFGVICTIEIFVGIILMCTAETTQQLIGYIPVTLIFAVPAFFLLKPSKKANNADLNSPSGEQINTKVCAACSKKIGLFSGRTAVADGVVCHKCLKDAGVSTLPDGIAFNTASLKYYLNHHTMVVRSFSPTSKVSSYIAVDENHKSFQIGKEIFEYDSLVRYELLENGSAVLTGGLGQVFNGGLFFINKGNLQGNCSSLYLKVSLRNAHIDTIYVNFIFATTPKDSAKYRNAQTNAESCVYLLQKIIEQAEWSTKAEQAKAAQAQAAQAEQNTKQRVAAIVDEIEKLNQLLYAGLITQEEFDAKKKQLLGL